MSNLQANNPEIFGTTSNQQAKFTTIFDPNDVNQTKQAALTENLALQQWGNVGPRK